MLVVTSYLKKVKPPRARPAGPRIKADWTTVSSDQGRRAATSSSTRALANTSSFPAAESTAHNFTHHGETHTHTLKTIITSRLVDIASVRSQRAGRRTNTRSCVMCAPRSTSCVTYYSKSPLFGARNMALRGGSATSSSRGWKERLCGARDRRSARGGAGGRAPPRFRSSSSTARASCWGDAPAAAAAPVRCADRRCECGN